MLSNFKYFWLFSIALLTIRFSPPEYKNDMLLLVVDISKWGDSILRVKEWVFAFIKLVQLQVVKNNKYWQDVTFLWGKASFNDWIFYKEVRNLCRWKSWLSFQQTTFNTRSIAKIQLFTFLSSKKWKIFPTGQ